MSSIENYDGLCGLIYLYSDSQRQIRCRYCFGHSGSHSWENIKNSETISNFSPLSEKKE